MLFLFVGKPVNLGLELEGILSCLSIQALEPPASWKGEREESTLSNLRVIKLLHLYNTRCSMGLDGIHPRAQQELVEELTNPLSITYQQFWLTRKIPDKWRLANGLSIYRKGQREDLGNYRSVSLTLMLGKITELIILEKCTLCGIRSGWMARPRDWW